MAIGTAGIGAIGRQALATGNTFVNCLDSWAATERIFFFFFRYQFI